MGGSIWPDYMGHFPPDYLGQLHRIFHLRDYRLKEDISLVKTIEYKDIKYIEHQTK